MKKLVCESLDELRNYKEDIENLNEGLGKKSILTLGMLLALVGSVKSQDDRERIIQTGIEHAENEKELKQNIVAASCVAVLTNTIEGEFQKVQKGESSIEAIGALKYLRKYYLAIRDGRDPEKLKETVNGFNITKINKDTLDYIKKLSWADKVRLLEQGKNLEIRGI